MFCSNCGAPINESMKFCPSCGAAVSAVEEAAKAVPDEPKKKRGSMWPWIIGTPIAFFILAVAIGNNMPEEDKQRYEQKRRVDQLCDEMIGDSALGPERRMTRQICDNMKSGR